MRKRGHSEEQSLRVLRVAESGDTVVEICRKHGIRQQTCTIGTGSASQPEVEHGLRRAAASGRTLDTRPDGRR